jgi:hypothetical protein
MTAMATFSQRRAIGRVNGGTQTTGGQSYPFLASLMPFVGIQSITYPNSGRVVSTGYDTAGRANCVTAQRVANCLSAPTTAYASSIAYAPQGGITSMLLGNQLTVATQFNSRLQPTQIQVGGGPNSVPGSYRVVTDLGRVIGAEGQTKIRVVFDGSGKIWSAFPTR